MRLSPKGIQNIKRGLKRSWESGSHRARQQTRKPDADDLMRRSLYDRRGKIVMSGSLSTELGQKPFQIRWSVFGRTDQLDFIVDGIIEKTCRPSAMMGFILSICGGTDNSLLTRAVDLLVWRHIQPHHTHVRTKTRTNRNCRPLRRFKGIKVSQIL